MEVQEFQEDESDFFSTTQEAFMWTLEDFSKIDERSIFSEVFNLSDQKWRILVHPKGIIKKYLSLSLVIADEEPMFSWEIWLVKLSMTVLNPHDPSLSIRKAVTHGISSRKRKWSFPAFMPLKILHDPFMEYLVNDTLVVEVHAEIIEKFCEDYDAKEETGFLGLEQEESMCGMNSLLQTLFHIPYFRKAVYHILPVETEQLSNSIPLALQCLFYQLQYNKATVSTNSLTESIGWNSYDSFIPHDVMELKQVLCEKLENKLKGTALECSVKKLFEGRHINYIECINLDFKLTREESFSDLQLDVKGCKDVYASLDQYVKVEKLEGDNKYDAGYLGFQDAWKKVLFKDFPPILLLHLKRFQYNDFVQKTMLKINDRYEFPLQLDLDIDNGRYLSPEADRSVRNVYTLYSVLVHSGGHIGEYYYAYIRPRLTDQWYEFNDEVVMKKETKKAIEEQYGGKEGETKIGSPNAYMLVYIREADKDQLMCKVDENDIAENHRGRLKKLLEGNEREIEKVQKPDLYMSIQVVTDEDLINQIGKDIYFGLVDHSRIQTFQVLKQTSLKTVKEGLAEQHGIQVEFWRFWICDWNQKNTYYLISLLTESEEDESVEYLQKQYGSGTVLSLYIECNKNKDGVLVPLHEIAADDIMLFIKLYDPYKERLQYVGKSFVKEFSRISEILQDLSEVANFPAEQKISLYKEIQFDPEVVCDRIDDCNTLDATKICLNLEEIERLPFPDVRSFLDYKHSKQIVHFRPLESPNKDEFCLELSRKDTYNEVVEKIAVKLGVVDRASNIRLTGLKQLNLKINDLRNPKFLRDMLPQCNQTSGILYFQVLGSSLSQQCSLKTLEVAIHNQENKKVSVTSVFLPGQYTIADVITVIKDKCKLCLHDRKAEIRVLEISSNMITKIFSLTEEIGDINDHNSILRAEEISAEEKRLGPEYALIHIYHFRRHDLKEDTVIIFGDPFLLPIHKDETLADVKARIKSKLDVPEDEFVKWMFALVSETTPLHYYLDDSEILFDSFQGMESSCKYYLGIDHAEPDSPPAKENGMLENGGPAFLMPFIMSFCNKTFLYFVKQHEGDLH